MPTSVNGIEGLKEHVGKELGTSEPYEVTQELVNLFADATGDHQWIHVDPERAKAGPFGGPIAHGYFTISLAPVLLAQILHVSGVTMGVNYGLNKLRFPSPVPVGGKVVLSATLAGGDEIAGGAQVTIDLTFQVEGAPKPACVAQAVYRYYT